MAAIATQFKKAGDFPACAQTRRRTKVLLAERNGPQPKNGEIWLVERTGRLSKSGRSEYARLVLKLEDCTRQAKEYGLTAEVPGKIWRVYNTQPKRSSGAAHEKWACRPGGWQDFLRSREEYESRWLLPSE